MMTDLAFAILHFLGAFALAGALVAQMAMLAAGPVRVGAMRFTRIDLIYALAALLVLVGGVGRVFLGLRGVEFYLANGFFHLKITAFILAALASIPPTITFRKWAKAARADPGFAPELGTVRRAKMWVHIQMALLIVVVVSASLMVRAYAL